MSVKEWRRVETGAFAGYLADIKGLKSDEIRLSARGEGWPFIIPESGHGIYRFGGWIVEAVVNEEEGAELIFTHSLPADDGIFLLFRNPAPFVRVAAPLEDGSETRTFEQVTEIEFAPGQAVRVMTNDPDVPNIQPGENIQANIQDNISSEVIAELKSELKLERRNNARLQDIIDGQLDNLLENLRGEQEQLDRELAEKASFLEETRNAVAARSRELDERRLELARYENTLENLRGEMEQSAALIELRKLDCETVRRELDGLREQNFSDQDTLELMREEPFLKGNSVRKTLEDAARSLEAAEKRLGLIIRLREKINESVRKTILIGDGTLPLSEELGGRKNVGSVGTQEQDSRSGAGDVRGGGAAEAAEG